MTPSWLSGTLEGCNYLLRGCKMLPVIGSRYMILMPIIGASLIIGMLYGYALWQIFQLFKEPFWSPFLGYSLDGLWYWLITWLAGLMFPFILFALLSSALFLITLLSSLLALPFHDILAERTLQLLQGTAPVLPWRRLIVVSLHNSLQKIGYVTSRFLLVWLITLIPVVQFLSPLLWLFFIAWMTALNFLDFPASVSGSSFTEMRLRSGRCRLHLLGFGLTTALCLLIPVINLLVIPIAVIAACILWSEQIQPQDKRFKPSPPIATKTHEDTVPRELPLKSVPFAPPPFSYN